MQGNYRIFTLQAGSRDQFGLQNITSVVILQAKLGKGTRGEVKKGVVHNFIVFWNTKKTMVKNLHLSNEKSAKIFRFSGAGGNLT